MDTVTDKRKARGEATRENILNAVIRCYRSLGVSSTTMEDVAREAGVGRATLYRHFSNQQSLLSAIITREMAAIRCLLEAAMPQGLPCEDYLVEGAVIILRETRKRGLSEILFSDESSGSISRMALSDSTITGFGSDWLEPFYARAKAEGVLRGWVTKTRLREWVSRVMISLLTTPSRTFKSDKALRAFFSDALVPSIIDRA